jgi:hypothetical protein
MQVIEINVSRFQRKLKENIGITKDRHSYGILVKS